MHILPSHVATWQPPLLAALAAALTFALIVLLTPTTSSLTKRLQSIEIRPVAAPRSDDRSVIVQKWMKADQRSKLRARLDEAGWYRISVHEFALRVVGCTVVCTLLGGCIAWYLGFSTMLSALIVGGFAVAGAILPSVARDRAAAARKTEIVRALPNFLDMVATTVQAGLALNAAMIHGIDSAPGALGDELAAALSEIRLGRARSVALTEMAHRVRQPQLSMTISAIVQAERLGSNLSQVLEELAAEMRGWRSMRAEEVAGQLPVKMVFPMALLMLPALFVIIIGPVVADYLAHQ